MMAIGSLCLDVTAVLCWRLGAGDANPRLPDIARLAPPMSRTIALNGLVMRCIYTRARTVARMAVYRLRSAPYLGSNSRTAGSPYATREGLLGK